MKKVLILGVNGFIGHHLSQRDRVCVRGNNRDTFRLESLDTIQAQHDCRQSQ